MSPFKLLKEFKPCTTWDWDHPKMPVSAREALNQEQAVEFAKRMHNAWSVAKTYITLAQQKKEHNVNKYQRPINFEPGDKVWVKTANWNTNWLSKKLLEQMAGLWKVLAKEGHSYKLQLPASIKINPVFPAGQLRRAADNPLPGQLNAPPPPIKVTAEDKYKV